LRLIDQKKLKFSALFITRNGESCQKYLLLKSYQGEIAMPNQTQKPNQRPEKSGHYQNKGREMKQIQALLIPTGAIQ